MTITSGGALPDAGALQLVSVTEAARMLGISRTLAYQLVARDELPSVRFGSRVYVLHRAVMLLLGACEDESLVVGGAGARPTERPAGRRRVVPDSQSTPAVPAAPESEARPRPRRRRPEPETQLTLFEPTDQPTMTTPTDPPSRRPYLSSTRSSNPRSDTDPYRGVPPSNQPDALAPGVRRGRVNVPGNGAGDRSGLNGSLNGEAGSGC